MNLLERLLVQREWDVLDAIDLDGMLLPCAPAERSHREGSMDTDDEASLISAALIDTGGVVARAARRLGLPRSSLRYKIRRYHLAHLLPTD
jgi:transcriptional regulator with GAF, ATPase, and Fis domain